MNKRILLVIVIGIASCSALLAREFRTPLPLDMRSGRLFNHYPYEWPHDIGDCCWDFNTRGAGFHRESCEAFLNKTTTKTENLSGIFFGKTDFFGIDAFALVNGQKQCDPLNPLLSVALISPRIDYSENSAVFGFTVRRKWCCDGSSHIGLRVNFPFRAIKVRLDDCCDLAEDIDDFCKVQNEVVNNEDDLPQNVEDSFAYRLDFLAKLFYQVNGTEKLVKFNDPANATDISIGGVDVTNRPALDINKNPVHVIDIDNGNVPPPPFALRRTTNVGGESVSTLPFLAANGSGVPNGTRARFEQNTVGGTDYTPLGTDANLANRRKLWVVPTAATVVAQFGLVQEARNIETQIASIVKSINKDVIEFFKDKNITFQTQCNTGIGDIDTVLFINKYWCCCDNNYFAEADFGVQWPSGKRIKDPGKLLLVPTGNNKHYEVRFGGILGWEKNDWLAVRLDAYYSWAIRHKETVAASFAGATVKNIGPPIEAQVSWSYFVGDLDFTFRVPCICPELGFDLGYQAYVKTRDNVSFDQTTAEDLLGNVQMLDPEVLELRTKENAHKVKAEFFYYGCSWQLFGGWQYAFAGMNAPQESDWYLGMIVYF